MINPFVDRRQTGRKPRGEIRRRYPRVKLELSGFYSSAERMLMMSFGNLNLRGTFIKTAAPDLPGTKATVRLETPGCISMLKFAARVVWSNEDPTRGPLGMGLKFEGLEKWQIKRVASFMLRTGGIDVFPSCRFTSLRRRI
ncbi:MAG: PilZ domain-containing protein [Deltaproteobacteria bacterium]|nr:PilZ domain-containing protein [Deltaproteobacteria bacterium]MBW1871984.1 PilZ domain-containing protein [Deltaproteobacteria bacterium]